MSLKYGGIGERAMSACDVCGQLSLSFVS